MIINDDNIAWALERLAQFAEWPRFPDNDSALQGRAKSFLRLVHNKTAEEIMDDALRDNPTREMGIDWSRKGIAPTDNDAEWILDYIRENLDEFPLPVHMREIYVMIGKIPPATESGLRPAESGGGQ